MYCSFATGISRQEESAQEEDGLIMIAIQIVIASLPYSVHYRIGGGFVAFIMCAGLGIRWIWQGLRNSIARDVFGEPRFAARWLYISAGVLLQIPLVLYCIFLVHQGYGS